VRASSSFASSKTPWPTFGLGKHHQAEITVMWPTGLMESFAKFKANKLVILIEGTETRKQGNKEKYKRK
jgi:hypothetical protein